MNTDNAGMEHEHRVTPPAHQKRQGLLALAIFCAGGFAAIVTGVLAFGDDAGDVDAGVRADMERAASLLDRWTADNPDRWVPSLVAVDDDGDGVADPIGGYPFVSDLNLSEGTTLEIVGDGIGTGQYVIRGLNPSGVEAAPPSGITYDSRFGGFQEPML